MSACRGAWRRVSSGEWRSRCLRHPCRRCRTHHMAWKHDTSREMSRPPRRLLSQVRILARASRAQTVRTVAVGEGHGTRGRRDQAAGVAGGSGGPHEKRLGSDWRTARASAGGRASGPPAPRATATPRLAPPRPSVEGEFAGAGGRGGCQATEVVSLQAYDGRVSVVEPSISGLEQPSAMCNPSRAYAGPAVCSAGPTLVSRRVFDLFCRTLTADPR